MMLKLQEELGNQISKETLTLACDRYCYVVDPPAEPIEGYDYDNN
jgi:hypothetical protein